MPFTLRMPLRASDIVRVTDTYHPPAHYGIDWSCLEGSVVYAAHAGKVVAGYDPDGFGTYVRLETDWGRTYYAHLSLILARKGAQIDPGEAIGLSGNTGRSTGPHLHFEGRWWEGGDPPNGSFDPQPYLVEEEQMTLFKGGLYFQGKLEGPDPISGRPGTHEWQELMKTPGMYCVQIAAQEWGTTNPVPGIRWLHRPWLGGDPVDAAYMWEGAAGAERWWQEVGLPHFIRTSPSGAPEDSWLYTILPANEPPYSVWEFLAPATAYHERLAELFHSVGKPFWGFHCSVGQPENLEFWPYLIDLWAACDVVCYHAYGAPTIASGWDWYAGRIFQMREVCVQHGGPRFKIALTEFGIDGGTIKKGSDLWIQEEQGAWFKKGWRDWEQYNLSKGRPPYKEQIITVNNRPEIQDEDTICFNPFLTIPQDAQWQSFDHNGEMVSFLCALFRDNGIEVPPDESDVIRDGWQASLDQIIPINPQAFLVQRMVAAGDLPQSDEFYWETGGVQYVGMVGRDPDEVVAALDDDEGLGATTKRLYYTKVGHYAPEDLQVVERQN